MNNNKTSIGHEILWFITHVNKLSLNNSFTFSADNVELNDIISENENQLEINMTLYKLTLELNVNSIIKNDHFLNVEIDSSDSSKWTIDKATRYIISELLKEEVIKHYDLKRFGFENSTIFFKNYED